MNFRLLLALPLACLVAGCANIRYLSVETPRPEGTATETPGICSPEKAHTVFREVASKLNLVVRGPVTLSPTETEYVAQGSTNTGGLILLVEQKRISIVVNVTGSDEEMQEAWRLATLIESVYAAYGIHPSVEVRKKAVPVK